MWCCRTSEKLLLLGEYQKLCRIFNLDKLHLIKTKRVIYFSCLRGSSSSFFSFYFTLDFLTIMSYLFILAFIVYFSKKQIRQTDSHNLVPSSLVFLSIIVTCLIIDEMGKTIWMLTSYFNHMECLGRYLSNN